MRTFTKKEIRNFVREDYRDEEYPTYKEIKNKDTGKGGRWTNYHVFIFELDGKFYRTGYSVAATETSWGSGDFEDCNDYDLSEEWPVEEVVQVEVVKTKWVPK